MKRIFLFLFAFTLIFSACKDTSDTVNLIEKSFEDEVLLLGNLSFTFDKNIVDDLELNQWDTIEYIEFDPEIKGRFMWTSPSTLMFSPVRQLKPSTEYTGELTDLIVEGKELKLGDETTFKFHTPYLQLTMANGYWAVKNNNSTDAFIHFNLEFNYDVKPNEVADLLTVEVDGEERDFTLIDEEVSDYVTFYIPEIKAVDKTIPAKITIRKGLNAAQGTLSSTEDIVEEMEITSPYKLIIQDVSTEHDGMTGQIFVYTSQRVEEKNMKKFIEIDPDEKYSIEVKDQYFVIKSEDFDVADKYTLLIKKDLKGTLGGKLKYEHEQDISFGKLQPSISFTDKKSMYLSGKGSKDISIKIVNVPKVKVTITKIYENNILSFLNNRYGYNDYYYDDYYYDDYYSEGTSYNTGSLGDVVYEEVIFSKDLKRDGANRILNLDFPDNLENYNGLYVVQVGSNDEYYLKDSKIISISDIGLIVKDGKSSVSVFANSIKDATPLSGVEINFIGNNNQISGTVTTDENGFAMFDEGKLLAPGFDVKMITASKNEDFNYLAFSMTYINTSKFEVGGKTENRSGYDAFIYGDRDIYRPGETVNITAILRDHQWGTPDKIPVKMKFLTPNGKVYKTIRKNLNDHGSFETSITTPASAMTGSYTIQLFTSNDVLIASKWVKIEEFVPDRIKVRVDLDKDEIKPKDRVKMTINAMNFFGPPAANRNYEVEESIKRKYFSPTKNRGYNYYIEGASTYFNQNMRNGKTDEDGNAFETFSIPSHYSHMGVLAADYFVTVFDETGRPVNRRKGATIYTQDVFYGIQYGNSYFKAGKQVRLPLIAVDKDGNAQNEVETEITLIKHEYKTVLNKSGGYFRYRSEHQEKILEEKIVKISGTASYFEFTPDLSGQYEIRVCEPGVNTYVSRRVYAYGYGRTNYSSFDVNNDGQIEIELDKEQYNVGEKAKVLMKTPFSGTVLVTVENNKVLKHFYQETDKRALSFDLDLQKDYVPNIYITATLIRPHAKSDLPFTVAHGYQVVMVENPENRLPLEIEAEEQSRSKTKQKIRIKSEPNSAVTVAVVDEGILQVTGFKTPDPYNFFYAKRALEVRSYDVYPFLFAEMGQSSVGGDGMNLEKRVNPMTNKRIQLVAFWSGILETDNSGWAEYEIDIPQFSGDLRIMAVNYKNKTFASHHTNMTVADPLVISSALPRFLSPRDTVDVPVMLSNTTGKKAKCKTTLTVSGPVKVLGSGKESTDIKANSESQVVFRVVVEPQIGQAKITVTADAMGETFTNSTDITVRPASPLIKYNGSGSVKAGSSKSISMDGSSFMPQSVDNKLVISKSPLVQFSDDLQYLVRYPYGCVEQTTSAAFPQIYFTDIVKDVMNDKGKDLNPAHNVNMAIQRLMLMQLYNGGLTYWPQHGSESWWGTAYAAHFVVEAQKAGFQVDQSFLDKMLDYLSMKLKRKETFVYYYNNTSKRTTARKETAYSLYVLALAGKPDRSMMNYYKSNYEQLTLDGKYLLAAAFALAGDKNSFNQLLPNSFEGEISNPVFGGSFYSPVRDEAIALNVLVEVDPDNEQVGIMARHISNALKTRRYLNTQERSFSFLALGKIARRAAESDIQAEIKKDGKVISEFDNKTITLSTKDLGGTSFDIIAKGKGELFYFWEIEGISIDGSYKEEDNFIMVRKAFYDRSGREIFGNTFTQNDLVVIKLSISGKYNTIVENVAISDILPAGFEIENPRITESAKVNWIFSDSKRATPDYLDIRDDRINMFVDVRGNQRNYYYMVRAVSRGIFQMGPVGADAMYNGEYHSYSGGGSIHIKEKL